VATRVQSPRRIDGLRRASLALCLMLIVELALGIGVNLFVNVPASYQGGMGKGFADALTKGPAALAVHAGIGLLLILAAIGLLVQAILARHTLMIASAAVALLTIVGAANSGASFVGSGKNADSMVMAMLTVVALLCGVLNLYVLGRPGVAGALESPTPTP
jgi:hypothetical protein